MSQIEQIKERLIQEIIKDSNTLALISEINEMIEKIETLEKKGIKKPPVKAVSVKKDLI